MGFWDYIERENEKRRAEQYIDNPNHIAWMSLAYGLVLVLFVFVFCPMNDKRLRKDYEELSRPCRRSFYKYPIYGIVKEKEIDTKVRVSRLHIQSLESGAIDKIDCRCDEVSKLIDVVEIGDTILKTADTLWIKVINYPKYSELNYRKTFKEE
ncbi:MAG: hypothetical protein JNL70_16635 [Saprospiraceae bacterium]|nr:hypothetical protein [Saprospiraceae bacterium]